MVIIMPIIPVPQLIGSTHNRLHTAAACCSCPGKQHLARGRRHTRLHNACPAASQQRVLQQSPS